VTDKINPFTEQPEPKSVEGEVFQAQLVGIPQDENEYQFHKVTITQLLVITFLCGATIALVSQFFLAGTLVLFAVFAITSGIFSLRQINSSIAVFVDQVLWGVLMPIACIVTDPLIFMNEFKAVPTLSNVDPLALLAYVTFGWQILNMIASWFLAAKGLAFQSWFSGTLLLGSIVALIVALCILPISVLGLFVVVGILGFTPWVTGWVYLKASRRYWPRTKNNSEVQGNSHWLFFAAGFCVALILPLAFYGIQVSF
jgi:hypothetical protein